MVIRLCTPALVPFRASSGIEVPMPPMEPLISLYHPDLDWSTPVASKTPLRLDDATSSDLSKASNALDTCEAPSASRTQLDDDAASTESVASRTLPAAPLDDVAVSPRCRVRSKFILRLRSRKWALRCLESAQARIFQFMRERNTLDAALSASREASMQTVRELLNLQLEQARKSAASRQRFRACLSK